MTIKIVEMTPEKEAAERARRAEFTRNYFAKLEEEKKAAERAAAARKTRAANRNKPTAKQLSYLKSLGHIGAAPTTKSEASRLIGDLKVERACRRGF